MSNNAIHAVATLRSSIYDAHGTAAMQWPSLSGTPKSEQKM